MSFRTRFREFTRHLYARFFGSFAIDKSIKDAELLLCSELGFPLLNIRCKKCEYSLHYTKNSTGITVVVYGANFYPHAYRLSVPHRSKDILVRDDPNEMRPVGRIHIYEDKMSSVVFYGAIDEAHSLHVDDGHVVAAAPVVEVSDSFPDGLHDAEDSDPIKDTERLIKTTDDQPGAVRFIPILTYSGKGDVQS